LKVSRLALERSVEALDSGFVGLNEHMERLRRFPTAEIANMAGASFMPALRNQVAQLANLPREKQFEGLLSIGDQIKNNPGRGGGVASEKRFLEFFGLPTNFADYSKRQIAEFYANYRRAHRDFTDAEQQAGLAADQAWADLREKMASFSDYVGAHWAPTVTAAMSGVGALFTALSSDGVSFFSKLRDDAMSAKGVPDAVASIRIALERDGPLIGAALEKILPDEQQFAGKIGLLIKDIARLEKMAHDIPDWARTYLGIHGPGFDIGKPMDAPKPQDRGKWGIHWRGHGWGDDLSESEPLPAPGAEARPHTPTPSPSIFDRLRDLVKPAAPPTAPAESPAPFAFPKPKPSGFSPIAFHPGGDENPVKPALISGGASAAIQIIRQGTAAGLFDWWQSLKAMGGAGGSGITNASFEVGPGGAGAGAGGPGSPAGRIGHEIRRQGGGGSGGAPGEAGGGDGAGVGGKFMDALARIESGNKNIYSKTDPDVPGPNSRSQGYFQINTPTWRDFAGKAGVDLAKYPDAMHSPRDVQEKVASVIPLSRFGPRTRRMLGQEFGPLDTHKPVGQLGPRDAPPGTLTRDYSGLRLKSGEAVAGGAVERGLADLARHEQEAEGKNFDVFSALRDKFHVFENPKSAHNQGLAFDATTQDRDYDAARQRMRAYLTNLGLKEGAMSGGSGDYAIEPGTRDHMHVQFNSHEAAERYHAMVAGADRLGRDAPNHSSMWGKSDPINPTFAPAWQKGLFREGIFDRNGFSGPHNRLPVERPPLPGQQDVSLRPGDLSRLTERRNRPEPGSLLHAADQRQAAASAKHEVTGSASLHIKLAAGLAPASALKTKGNLFKETRLDRAPLPLASTTG
jgi:hypothetical protein